jgi:hypothetical protein
MCGRRKIDFMTPQGQKEISDAEVWKKIPIGIRVEVDMAIDHGNKPLAINHCMCADVGFTLLTAMKFVEQRSRVLPKRIPNKTN